VNFSDLIQTVLIYALPVIFAITLHEAAHGYVAHRLGDNTAWMMGRVTLNPIPHIDPMGTLVMPVLLFLATGGNFLFGYARPVPVRFGNLNHPKRDMVWGIALYLCVGMVQSWHQGQCRDVCLQPVSPAAARRWPHLGGPVALEASRLAVQSGTLGFLHRDGLGRDGRHQQLVDGPFDDPHL